VSPLRIVGQDDFAAGVIRGVAPDVMPGVGLANAINGLYNDDGDVYRRGTFSFFAVPPAATSDTSPTTLLWSGFLSGAPKLLIADTTRVGTLTALGMTGDFVTLAATPQTQIQRPAVVANQIYLPNGVVWGGAVTKADYVVGTVALTGLSDVAVGTGTSWSANVESGQFLIIGGAYYRILAVTDNTHLKLDHPAPATVATTAYKISRTATWVRPVSLAAGATLRLCSVAGRLVVAANNRIAFSNADAPWAFSVDDYHELPGGVQVMGLASIRDTLLGFSNFGLWSVANMSYDLTDAQGNIQQTLSLLTPEVSLWQEGGLCEWNGKIIAPCIDKIFVVDALSAPVPISTSIAPDYQSFVRGGFQLGGARVFNNHLFMPVLDSALGASALYVCRLDRPVQGRQLYFPWSTFTNSARSVTHFDVALIAPKPMLLGAQTNHVFSDYAPVFTPDVNNRLDSGSQAYEFDVETRDFPTGNGQPNHVRKLRLRYTLEGDAAILAGYSYGSVAQTYDALRSGSTDYADVKVDYANYEIVFRGPTFIPGGLPASPDDPARFWYTLYDQTPPDPGVDPVTWQLPQAQRVRYIRFRFRTTDAPARLVVHHLDFHVRSAGHDR
jgi:hypothetical protein